MAKHDATDKILRKIKKDNRQFEPKNPIAMGMFLPNHSGDHTAGIVRGTPQKDTDIANKKYVDDSVVGGDVTAAQNLTDIKIVQGDGGAKGVKTSNATVTQVITSAIHSASDGSDHSIVVANQTHAADSTQAHSDYLLNNAVDIGVQMTLTGDEGDADTQYTAQVLYNTDATPPTASGFPIGTIYIQYTA